MKKHFPLAHQFPAIPPEIRFFCAAPWNIAALASVKAAADQAGFYLEQALTRNMPEGKKEAFARMLQLSLQAAESGPEGLGQAFYAYKVLPFMMVAGKPNDPSYAVLTKNFDPEDVKKLALASSTLDWNQAALDTDIPAMKFVLFERDTTGRSIEFYVAPDRSSTLNDLPAAILTGAGMPDSAMANSAPFGPVFVPWMKSFLPASLGLQLGMLSAQIAHHIERAKVMSTSPASFFDTSDNRALRVYILNTFPANPCGIPSKAQPASYCPQQRWILVQASLEQDVLDGVVQVTSEANGMPRGYGGLRSATLHHELSHAIYDPTRPERMPFLIEGRASNEGEQVHKATRAGLEVSRADSVKFMELFRKAVTTPEGSSGIAEDAANQSLQIAAMAIAKQRPTPTQLQFIKDFLCRKPSAEFVARQLSLSNESFRAQGLPDQRLAYATGSVFHYFGYFAGDKTLRFPRQQVDISDLYTFGNAIAVENVALTAVQKEKINAWLAELTRLAMAENTETMTCDSLETAKR